MLHYSRTSRRPNRKFKRRLTLPLRTVPEFRREILLNCTRKGGSDDGKKALFGGADSG